MSDGVSPSPKGGGAEPARPPLNQPMILGGTKGGYFQFRYVTAKYYVILSTTCVQ